MTELIQEGFNKTIERKEIGFEELNEKYENSMDSLLQIIKGSWYVEENYKKIKLTEKTPHYKLLMRLELSKLSLDVNYYLGGLGTESCGFIGTKISVLDELINNQKYESTLSSTAIQL